jgi:hypothetical protein
LIISCEDDLNQNPTDPDLFTEVDVYSSAQQALGALAKVYAGLAVTGQAGPDGQADIDGSIIDEGFSSFTRIMWNLNEASTDTGIISWISDPGVPDINQINWEPNNPWTKGMYYRMAQNISFANSFIENATELATTSAEVATYINEARFIRAYCYSQLIDMYGGVPVVSAVSAELPEQATRSEVFSFIESELIDLSSVLPTGGASEYGHVDRVAASALLTRLYLNSEVYTGQTRYGDVITQAENVFSSSYSINTADGNNNGTAYDELFLADNNSNGAQNEFIFALLYDGISTQTWGGATFLVHAPIGGSMNPADFGVNGGWGGLRTTKGLVQKFDYAVTQSNGDGEPVAWSDPRAMFHTDGQTYETEKMSTFKSGYAVRKFKNVDVNGNPGSDSSGNHPDMDVPVIRLAEVYLNYAEAVARGGGGTTSTAVSLINELRSRAGAPAMSSSEFSKNAVMDERARELYWEGFRRPDLIRDNKFITGAYMWPFKGGAANGTSVSDHFKLFPIPEDILLVNPNIKQNPNY